MKTPEGALKAKINAWFKARPKYYKFMPVQTGYGERTLDYLCCMQGRFIAIETKAPGKKPTPLQEVTAKRIQQAGGIAFWCDNFDGFLLNIHLYFPEK